MSWSSRVASIVRPAFVDSALPLALLRIVVPIVIVLSPELWDATRLAGAPERLVFVPEGLGLVARIPIGTAAASVLRIVALSSAATTALGYFSRASAATLTLSAALLFSLTQRQGAVVHDMHLFWMSALLAASACGDAWSLDAWGKPRPAPSMQYGVPLAFARALLGVVYFFPGLHKLRVSGLAWLTSDNVIGHMQAKWLEHASVPSIRIDHSPMLCAAGAIFVVAFELSFGFLAFFPRTRLIALVTGIVFHVTTQLLFFITFTSLWACYVVLLPSRLLSRPVPVPVTVPVPVPAVVLGTLLLSLAAVQGARAATQAWPFACYPTFSHVQPRAIPDLALEARAAGGTMLVLTGREHRARSQAEWGRVFRISGAYGDPIDPNALRVHATEVLASTGSPALDPSAPLRIYRVDVATAPERWSEPPDTRRGVLLTELAPLPSTPR